MSTYVSGIARGFSKAHYLVSVAAALMLAGCSQSVERFADGASSENPSNSDPVYTASVPKHKRLASADDDDTITSRPLARTKPYKTAGGYAYNRSTYTAPAYKAPKVPQVALDDEPAVRASGGRVTVGQGMTLYSIARSNNVTVAELAAANRLKAPYAVHAGQVLRIPGGSSGMTPAKRTASAQLTAGGMHEVSSGDTLFSLGRKYGVSPYAIADLNDLSHDFSLKRGQQVKIPANGNIAVAAKSKARLLDEPDTEDVLADDTVAAQSEKPAAAKELALDEPVADASTDEPSIGMRWPVRGKIISSYGSKPNGLKNEGINIAVPEGASVRAAEKGVVAYAGNELKGYGNLVLIRHDGGFVTAYAHAKELFVKRGDEVKRGDVIAKAGQTGSVSSPQLHFEVRKGATALDPIKFLSSSTASN